MNNLSPEEQDILQSYENDEWISIADDKLLKNYQQVARNTFKNDRSVNLSISRTSFD